MPRQFHRLQVRPDLAQFIFGDGEKQLVLYRIASGVCARQRPLCIVPALYSRQVLGVFHIRLAYCETNFQPLPHERANVAGGWTVFGTVRVAYLW